MNSRLKLIKTYLLRGYSLENIGRLMKIDDTSLFVLLQRHSSYFKDLTWVLKRK